MKSHWMIYGANGYSAQLAIEKAVERGDQPILAGRSRATIETLATTHGLQARVFNLDDQESIVEQLADVQVVSNCAGPFSATAEPMMRACIAAGTHYTDITGEIDVFELSQHLDDEARHAGVVLCPGVGFDVIPTDCIAAALKDALPDATRLCLGFEGMNALSPGTAKTMVESISAGMKVRKNHDIIRVAPSFEAREIDFGAGSRSASVIPWGDLATAYWHTRIPNISVYTPRRTGKTTDLLLPLVQKLMSSKAVQTFARNRIERRLQGPDEQARASGRTRLWGEVTNDRGDAVTCRSTTANGYTVTMDGILLTAAFFLDYEGPGGCFTPAQIMGADLIEKLPGSTALNIERTTS